jgi:hypothetical protein
LSKELIIYQKELEEKELEENLALIREYAPKWRERTPEEMK